jgi:hypothetical protein
MASASYYYYYIKVDKYERLYNVSPYTDGVDTTFFFFAKSILFDALGPLGQREEILV